MEYRPGALVHVRERDWVVLPSPSQDLLLLKPLDGADSDTTGIYLPLAFEEDRVHSAVFPPPSVSDLGAFSSARLLYNAARLSLRNASRGIMCQVSYPTSEPLIVSKRSSTPSGSPLSGITSANEAMLWNLVAISSLKGSIIKIIFFVEPAAFARS